ncbi:MAG TPA: RNA polymerase sigma factor [Candidatus Paceibacterota bacterium]|nr:RNA polymerase sigma factor [Candidatus Paceibacterota bacterium]
MTDEDAARLVQKGDRERFGILVERYEEKLLRYGRKFLSRSEDIEDIVQEVFMSCYQNLQSFDTTQKFSPWIYRIAHNAFVNGLRKQKRSPLVFVDFDALLAHPVYEDPVPLEREQTEVKKMIEKCLDTLSPKYREVLALYYLEELSYKEISDIIQVPTGTVGIRIKRAKEALKTAYEELNPDHGA